MRQYPVVGPAEGKRTLLSAGLLDFGGSTDTDETVVRLEFLQSLVGIVDESETSGLATTELCAETEDGDLVLVGLVEVGQLLTELILLDVGAVGVEDVPENMLDSIFHTKSMQGTVSIVPSILLDMLAMIAAVSRQ